MNERQAFILVKALVVAMMIVILALLFLTVAGCESSFKREHSGKEAYLGLCVHCYFSEGEKSVSRTQGADEDVIDIIVEREANED